jgi:imidazole glycerol-phosphate synthase subunit HisF
MRRVRVIPVLLLTGSGLVKTVQFAKPTYVGDPINTARLFNDKEVDELVVLDIDATREGRGPDIARIAELASECFMPIAYGGGVTSIDHVEQILEAGVEKVVINSAMATRPAVITEAAARYGSQAVVVSIDVRAKRFRGQRVYTHGGRRSTGLTPADAAARAEDLGAGEILVTSIDRDGTYTGYDLEMIRAVSGAVSVPVIACGGARSVDDFLPAVRDAGASAVAAGSMFVFQGPRRAVLVNFPAPAVLHDRLFSTLGNKQGHVPE